jgi:hypothetical protein
VMRFSAISSSFLGHSSLFTELLLMFWYLPVSLNVKSDQRLYKQTRLLHSQQPLPEFFKAVSSLAPDKVSGTSLERPTRPRLPKETAEQDQSELMQAVEQLLRQNPPDTWYQPQERGTSSEAKNSYAQVGIIRKFIERGVRSAINRPDFPKELRDKLADTHGFGAATGKEITQEEQLIESIAGKWRFLYSEKDWEVKDGRLQLKPKPPSKDTAENSYNRHGRHGNLFE